MTWVEITVLSPEEGYQITTFLEGVRIGRIICKDLTVIQEEVTNRSRMMMGLAKGKTYAPIQGRH